MNFGGILLDPVQEGFLLSLSQDGKPFEHVYR